MVRKKFKQIQACLNNKFMYLPSPLRFSTSSSNTVFSPASIRFGGCSFTSINDALNMSGISERLACCRCSRTLGWRRTMVVGSLLVAVGRCTRRQSFAPIPKFMSTAMTRYFRSISHTRLECTGKNILTTTFIDNGTMTFIIYMYMYKQCISVEI